MGISHVSGSPESRAKAALAPLTVLCCGFLAAVLLFEITARTFFRAAHDHALPRRLVTLDDYLGWRLSRGVHVTHTTSDFEVDYAINSLGFRDEEPRPEADPRRFRILLYGDSQVFGWGVPNERRFSDRIEDRLESVEIWNMAVPGYGLDQQALAYGRDGADFDDGAVMLFLSQATLHRISFDYFYGIHKPSFRLRNDSELHLQPPKKGAGRAWLHRLPSWLYFPYVLDQALTRLEQRLGAGRLSAAESGPRQELVREILRLTLGRARSRQQRLIVLTDLSPPEEGPVQDACLKLQVELMKIRLPQERQALALGETDPHWNATAHELIAEQLVAQLAAFRRRIATPAGGSS